MTRQSEAARRIDDCIVRPLRFTDDIALSVTDPDGQLVAVHPQPPA